MVRDAIDGVFSFQSLVELHGVRNGDVRDGLGGMRTNVRGEGGGFFCGFVDRGGAAAVEWGVFFGSALI